MAVAGGLTLVLYHLHESPHCFFAPYVWMAFALVLLLNVHPWVRRWVAPVVTAVWTFVGGVNLACYLLLDTPLTLEFYQTLLNTYPGEMYEFAVTYFKPLHGLYVALAAASLVAAYRSLNGHRRWCPVWMQAVEWVVLVGAIALTVRHPVVMDDVVGYYGDGNTFRFEQSVDLRNHLTHPVIRPTASDHPADLVLIIGEAYAKTHSSLYGYPMPTCPGLQRLSDDRLLCIYADVTAPATLTTDVFRSLLNDRRATDESPWYESTTIIEALQSVGYHAAWVSSQEPHGLYDNLPAASSRLCQKVIFTGGDWKKNDDAILRVRLDSVVQKGGRNFVIYHLMGQHETFAYRTTDAFRRFTPDDYPTRPPHQRQTLADYDNATLFNDHVVTTIMERYARRDAVVVYLPDHGMDIYETDANYCGHARLRVDESVEVARRIPFVVYMSPLFQRLHPESTALVRELSTRPMCTDRLYDYLLAITHYTDASHP